ncbi:hypothetical protein dsx2_1010 [Desulfovibrio sp. X2]|nr:hypothetical protein dsx2_1010 [Desulfovibrio sp. X2]
MKSDLRSAQAAGSHTTGQDSVAAGMPSAVADAAETAEPDPRKGDVEISAILDENFVFQDVDSMFCSAIELGCEQVVGRRLFDVPGLEDFSELFADPLGRCLRGEDIVVESRFSSYDGERVRRAPTCLPHAPAARGSCPRAARPVRRRAARPRPGAPEMTSVRCGQAPRGSVMADGRDFPAGGGPARSPASPGHFRRHFQGHSHG